MDWLGLGGVIGGLVDDFVTTDEEKAQAEQAAAAMQLERERIAAQSRAEVLRAEQSRQLGQVALVTVGLIVAGAVAWKLVK